MHDGDGVGDDPLQPVLLPLALPPPGRSAGEGSAAAAGTFCLTIVVAFCVKRCPANTEME